MPHAKVDCYAMYTNNPPSGAFRGFGVTQSAFAEKIGWTRARLNELIKGKRGITAEAALDLAEVLGTMRTTNKQC